MSPAGDGIADDLGGFMPLRPSMTNSRGDIISLLAPEEIETWLEEHPDAACPASLAGVKTEDNPVVVIISR